MPTHWGRRAVLRGAAALAVTGGCGGSSGAGLRSAPTGPAGRPSSPLAANADLGVWPEQIVGAPPEVRQAYEYAVRGPRSLRYIPCYCGCTAAGHRDNQDCYVRTFASDGWVVLDLHGYG